MRGSKRYKELGPDLFGGNNGAHDGTRIPGRNQQLLNARNERLAARLHYYKQQHPEYSYEYVISRLSEEFDLMPITIPQIIDGLAGVLARLRRERPAVEELRKRWPWMVW